MSSQITGSVQNKLTGTILLISYLCRRFLLPTIIVIAKLSYRLLCSLLMLIFNTYLFVGSKVFKNIIVCHLMTLAFICVSTLALVSSMETKEVKSLANIQESKNIELKIKLSELEEESKKQDSNLEALLKLSKELDSITPAKENKLEYKSIETKTIPEKWKSHIDYLKYQDSQAHKIAIAGFKANQEKYGFYGKSACHPYIMAAIHYREIGYRLNNGWNGQGIYQLYSTTTRYPSNSPVTNATAQTQQACEFIKNKAKSYCSSVGSPDDLNNLENIELLGCALAKYNGCNGQHYNNCGYTVKGMSKDQEVFNKKCADDGCSYFTTEKQLGALTIIAILMANS
jgi:hypothetical protein